MPEKINTCISEVNRRIHQCSWSGRYLSRCRGIKYRRHRYETSIEKIIGRKSREMAWGDDRSWGIASRSPSEIKMRKIMHRRQWRVNCYFAARLMKRETQWYVANQNIERETGAERLPWAFEKRNILKAVRKGNLKLGECENFRNGEAASMKLILEAKLPFNIPEM